jgi:GT2 family glycosyltransferase
VTVYNGRGFVPRCLRSAVRLDRDLADIDVLALDDCSPEPGFSEFLESECRELGVTVYRSPRNLGIVRNVNLGLLAAMRGEYDYVVISNSDVVYSRQTVSHLLEAILPDTKIGSVTAWSNNVSIFSLPNEDPDRFLSSQDVLDWLSASLAGHYRGTAVDIPAGISFCVMIPAGVIRDVGLMDPVFGRGYCEETDWTLRSQAMGYRIALAPAAFVYHQGRGSTLAAGMVSGGHTTVPENEAVIDYRYPLFRSQVDAFVRGGILERLRSDALRLVIHDAGRQFGYRVLVDPVPSRFQPELVEVVTGGYGEGHSLEVRFRGFTTTIPRKGLPATEAMRQFFDSDPESVELFGGGPVAQHFAKALGVSATLPYPAYPTRV